MNKARPGLLLRLLPGSASSSSARTRVGSRNRRRRYVVSAVAAASALTFVAIGSTGAYFSGQVASATQTGTAGNLPAVAGLTATKSGSTSGQSTAVSWTDPSLSATGAAPVYTVSRNTVNAFGPSSLATSFAPSTATTLTDSSGGSPITSRQATQVASTRVASTTAAANQGSFAVIGGKVYRWGTLKLNGTGAVWGSDGAGGPDFTTGTPTLVAGFTEDVRQLATGVDHLCALTVTGKVFCVGYNATGQLGNGTVGGTITAVDISANGALAGKTIIQIAAGDGFSCALASDGMIACWGDNGYGELGNGNTNQQNTPVKVMNGSSDWPAFSTYKPIAIGASNYSMCAIKGPTTDSKGELTYPPQNERLACWGRNNWQQLGTSSADTSAHSSPVNLPDPNNALVGATKVTGGHAVMCALTSATTVTNVACWGGGGLGVLGDGGTGQTPSPTTVLNPTSGLQTGYTDLTVGFAVACATKGSQYSCWGQNGSGQLGNGVTATGQFKPREPATIPGMTTDTITSITNGPYFVCATTNRGGVACWGEGDGNALGQGASNSTDYPTPRSILFKDSRTHTPLSADLLASNSGNEYQVARIGGKVYSWSRKLDATVSSAPVEITGMPSDMTKMAAGYYHVCAINGTSGVWCAGSADQGKLGNNNATGNSSAAVAVTDTNAVFAGKTLVDITAWDMGTCALASDGTIGCWGQNDAAQLARTAGTPASSPVPVAVTSATLFPVGTTSKATKITASWDTVCVEAGATGAKYLACWGANADYTLGAAVATSVANSATPVKFTDAGNRFAGGVTAIDGARTTFCAIAASNSYTYCWGRGADGQLGNGASTIAASQTLVEAFTTAGTTLSVSGLNACVATAAGVSCWGYRDLGGVGAGSGTGYAGPTPIIDPDGALEGGSVSMFSGGWAAMCMLTTTGSLSCWGANDLQALGQQGPNATTNFFWPTFVHVGTHPTTQPVSGSATLCLDGAIKVDPTTCSLVPGRTYWYQVGYTVPGADAWVSGKASTARS